MTSDSPAGKLPRLLVVDDEPSIRESLRIALRKDFDVVTASGGQEALARFDEAPPDAVLLDILMPDTNGIALLEKIRAIDPETAVIMLTAVTSIKTVVEAMRLGADDYITKPFDIGEIKLVIAKALERKALKAEVRRLKSELAERFRFDRLVGRSKSMRAVYETIEQVADRKTTVLIRGESGTGKELVARAIHYTGARRDKPFVVVNCAAIPATLIESELFGHEKGAFTDARDRRIGRFEAADGGTLFLDEIGELAPGVQATLLRVLQEREFQRVGGTTPVRVDVRVVAATNRDLEQDIANGTFRKDLYYRINVVPLLLPPLRERNEDVPGLVEHFLDKYAESGARPKIDAAAIDALVAYAWPGNVRELENTIERLVALGPPEGQILPEHLPRNVVEEGRLQRLRADVLAGRIDFEQAVQEFERDLIAEGLARAGGIQTRAAEILGISRRILKYKMDRAGVVGRGE